MAYMHTEMLFIFPSRLYCSGKGREPFVV